MTQIEVASQSEQELLVGLWFRMPQVSSTPNLKCLNFLIELYRL